ncbi:MULTISPECIES: MBL fold metallo-hydrolase [unclassified Clostridium]|uniref:MBL fold metallo-hydrolase n=1 Tax=unclassified Clostridium TaxID=2614128 RepID=UPI00029790B5|nr:MULTISPECIES: MBL fold metallo-hydrolase [unclassified Clostridium]EKQ56693.1 MAG: Zn-dependent hydrolase, glyoxylase [Clostridium sp. Maddingley MBC34-26]
MGNKMVEFLSEITTKSLQITPEILILEFTVVNAFIISNKNNEWVLVDTGLENSADFIIKCAEEKFGKNSRPQAIILTHGHFDHVGSVITLCDYYNIPAYIHELELPYVTGVKDYPLADPTVDEGMVAKISRSFSHTSIDLGKHAKVLPKDNSVPGLPDWKYIHTPGHSEGHISLYKEEDKILIAGDAFCTVKQESIISVLTQNEQISGPPKYLTTNWEAAEESVNVLSELKPNLAIPSHGKPMEGDELTQHLNLLKNNFKDIAKPRHGKFV